MLRTNWCQFVTATSFMAIASCGGGDGVTPPAPVLTAIEVSPATKAMLVGETVTLSASGRDQNGAPMTGISFAWSTSDAAIASVSGAGTVTANSAGTATISATASGKTGTATVTINKPVPSATLEPSNRVTATIGAAGGTISAASAAGIQYTLEIPAGALQSAQEIRMTPVAAISHLGLTGGLSGAVELQPSGLVLAQPALLRIRSSSSAPAGTRLVGFSANADFSQRELSITAAASGEVIVLVSHFSFSGAGFGTTEDVSQFPVMLTQSLEVIWNQILAISPVPWNATGTTQASQLAQQAFGQFVLPALKSAATDAALLDAVSDYIRWRFFLAVIKNSGFPPIALMSKWDDDVSGFPMSFLDEVEAGLDAAADGIRLAIDANAVVCGDQGSLNALRNVFFWQDWALRLSVAVAPGLDPATVLNTVRSKCATVVLKNSNMPDSLPAGQNFNLDLNFALRFRNGVEQPADFRIDLAGSGVNVTNPGGFTGIGDALSPVGYYTTVITPASDLGFRLGSQGCFVPVRSTPEPTELCGAFELTKVIYFNDFQGPAGDEWSITTVATSPVGERYLGELRFQGPILTLDSIPLHTELELGFDLYIIDSWNGNGGTGSSASPDVLTIEVQGGAVLKRTTFSNKPRDAQAFPGDLPGSSFPAGSGSLAIGSLGYPAGSDFFGDSSYRLRLRFDHTANTIALIFGSQQTSGQNERWGIDNVRVKIVSPP